MKTFHFRFGLHPSIRENPCIIRSEDLFFGLYPRIREISPGTPLFLGPRSQIQSIKVFVTPHKFFMPPPPSHTILAPGLKEAIARISVLLFIS